MPENQTRLGRIDEEYRKEISNISLDPTNTRR